MLCLHPPLIVEMSLCPVQGAVVDDIKEGYMLHTTQNHVVCIVWLAGPICLLAWPIMIACQCFIWGGGDIPLKVNAMTEM